MSEYDKLDEHLKLMFTEWVLLSGEDILQELHLRRECEEKALALGLCLNYDKTGYSWTNHYLTLHGPYTLPQLHEKLTELTEKQNG